MPGRVMLWAGFVLVHVFVIWLGWVEPSQPMGDVYNVYEPWSLQAVTGAGIVGITESWVYPQLALLPMVMAHVFDIVVDYTLGWALLVAVADAVAFAILVGDARSRGRVTAALFWLAGILLLGPVGIYRLDGVTVPVAVLGALWIVRRPWLGSVLLAAAAWMKIWPVAFLAAAVVALRRRWTIVAGAAVVTAAIAAIVVSAGGAAHLLGFVTGQTGRGLQLEAPVSTLYLWQTMLGIDGSFVFYSPDMLTFQVTGPGVDAVITAMTPLLAVVVLGIMALAAVQRRRGVGILTLLPTTAFALVLTMIVFNKVGSPQFATWLFAPVVLGLVLDRRRWWDAAAVVLGIAALTHVVYPLMYDRLLVAAPAAVVILTLRNLAYVGLWVWMIVRIARMPAPPRSADRTARRALWRAPEPGE